MESVASLSRTIYVRQKMECMMEMSQMGKIARMSMRGSGKKLGVRAVFLFFFRETVK